MVPLGAPPFVLHISKSKPSSYGYFACSGKPIAVLKGDTMTCWCIALSSFPSAELQPVPSSSSCSQLQADGPHTEDQLLPSRLRFDGSAAAGQA